MIRKTIIICHIPNPLSIGHHADEQSETQAAQQLPHAVPHHLLRLGRAVELQQRSVRHDGRRGRRSTGETDRG